MTGATMFAGLHHGAEVSGYERMCAAIEDCHAHVFDDLAKLPPEQELAACLRIAQNLQPENQAVRVRLRAERNHQVLLRDAAGLPPKNKRDGQWLARIGATEAELEADWLITKARATSAPRADGAPT